MYIHKRKESNHHQIVTITQVALKVLIRTEGTMAGSLPCSVVVVHSDSQCGLEVTPESRLGGEHWPGRVIERIMVRCVRGRTMHTISPDALSESYLHAASSKTQDHC